MKSRQRLTEEQAYSIWRCAVDDIAQSTIAICLYELHRRKWRKDRIQNFYSSCLSIINQPPVFGRYITNADMVKFISEKYDIPLNDLKMPAAESYENIYRNAQKKITGGKKNEKCIGEQIS